MTDLLATRERINELARPITQGSGAIWEARNRIDGLAAVADRLANRAEAAEADRDLLFSELAEARRELRDGLSDRDLLTDVPPDLLVDEVLALIDRGYQQYTELRSLYVDLLAANARLLDVYRAAEAWAGAVRLVQAVSPTMLSEPSRELLAALDTAATWTPAKVGDTPGELVPGEGEAPQPIRAGTPAEAPRTSSTMPRSEPVDGPGPKCEDPRHA